jgi:hypothetical protein
VPTVLPEASRTDPCNKVPRSRNEIVEALAQQHAKDEVKRTIMRLSVTGRLVETKHKYRLTPLPEPDQG